MQRYKLTIAYRGTRYHGWQRQPTPPTWNSDAPPEGQGIPTVQEELSRAISVVVGHPVRLVGSSRTDSGVHAKGQVAHFDTEMVQIPPENLRRAINAKVYADIVVRSIEPVEVTFDAISSTISKRYQYLIWHAPDRSPFITDLAWHRWQALDIDAMKRAASHLIGEHDFAAFAKPGHNRTHTVRTVHEVSVSRRGKLLVIGVEGSGFLWNMVRIIVGTLVDVGIGHYDADAVATMLASKDRRESGSTAPAKGLYLQWIRYANEQPSSSRPASDFDSTENE
jgi:tRNA pseudouridine38-40 synthase